MSPEPGGIRQGVLINSGGLLSPFSRAIFEGNSFYLLGDHVQIPPQDPALQVPFHLLKEYPF